MAKEWADTERAKNFTFFRYWIEKHRQAQEQCVSMVGERVSAQEERDGTQKRHRSRKLNQFFF